MMARFWRYLDKVFDWSDRVALLSDARVRPQISTAAVFLSAFIMCATRLRSLNALEGELRVPRRWEPVVGARKPSADRVGQVVALLDSEELRDMLAGVNHTLRRNKALDENPWPLRFAALDAHEFFSPSKALLRPVLSAPGQGGRPRDHRVLSSRRRGPPDRL